MKDSGVAAPLSKKLKPRAWLPRKTKQSAGSSRSGYGASYREGGARRSWQGLSGRGGGWREKRWKEEAA
jgi:hypothetical protein